MDFSAAELGDSGDTSGQRRGELRKNVTELVATGNARHLVGLIWASLG